jgi:hypothetical protein
MSRTTIKFYSANGKTNFHVRYYGAYADGYIYRAEGKIYIGGGENIPDHILTKIADKYERIGG